MSSRAVSDEPIVIGSQSLFGLYHGFTGSARCGAVLLCAPLGQDQIRSHRLYRQLALALNAIGYAVLRFDYFGTGDSPGDSAEVDWSRCLADIATAADELRRRSGCDEVIAYGARLGGTLALEAAHAARFGRIIAWDPVLDGTRFAAQMDNWQAMLCRDPERYIKPRAASDAVGEWLGFATSSRLRERIATRHAIPADIPTVLLQSSDTAAEHAIASTQQPQVSVQTIAAPSPWNDYDRVEDTVLAPQMIRTVCATLEASS